MPTGHTLFAPDALIAKNLGKAPGNMTAMASLVSRMRVAPALDAPTSLPAVSEAQMLAVKEYLCGGTGAVPTLADLGLEVEGGGSPFKVRLQVTEGLDLRCRCPMSERAVRWCIMRRRAFERYCNLAPYTMLPTQLCRAGRRDGGVSAAREIHGAGRVGVQVRKAQRQPCAL